VPPISYADSLGWPSVERGMIALAPVRVGADRKTGRILIGWEHTLQSIETILATRFHERILRQWAGSFVPHLLGQSMLEVTITRFFWSIATAIELWEPNYRIRRINVLNRDGSPADGLPDLTSVEEARLGHLTFEMFGIHRPRGHLGDFTEAEQRSMALVGNGAGRFDRLRTG
jgi:phage baseplate assembly protein W